MCKKRVFSSRTELLHIHVVGIYLLIGNTRCFPALQEAVIFGENNSAPKLANLSSAKVCYINEKFKSFHCFLILKLQNISCHVCNWACTENPGVTICRFFNKTFSFCSREFTTLTWKSKRVDLLQKVASGSVLRKACYSIGKVCFRWATEHSQLQNSR